MADERSYNPNNPVQGSRDPISVSGDRRATNSGESSQFEQQRMNSEAQYAAAINHQGYNQQPQVNKGRTIVIGGREIPFTPAPVGHAAGALTRLAQKAREQERTNAIVDLHPAATPDALANARYVLMPAGGIQALAEQTWPNDLDNRDAMDDHVHTLLILNRDTLVDDTAYSVNQLVRVPA